MEIIAPDIMEYAENHSEKEPELLAELRRETWQKVVNPRMLSGVYQGRLLAMLSKIIQPKKIVEIGTYTGYATLCLAEGLPNDGILYTIDCNEELTDIQQKYFLKSGKNDRIVPLLGEALTLIPELENEFDLIFLDADKSNYLNYLQLIISKVKQGGIIITDNVLWSGKVLNPTMYNDTDTQLISEFNRNVSQNTQLETLLLPIRDGLSIVRKK